MFEGTNRKELRQFYFDVWHKHQTRQPLEPLEQQILHIMLQHPEYHEIFNHPESYIEQDYLPEMGKTNPFLHLSLHQGLIEQITTDRPAGIRAIYAQLLQCHDVHTVEHQMIETLGEVLWESINQQRFVDEEDYLERLRRLI